MYVCRCSDIAAAILDLGGNAMDAAVAATFCLGVVGPSSRYLIVQYNLLTIA
jgi:gamma-glutamyltranspeptidase